MKVSDYIAEFLYAYVEHIFVGNGGCVIHLLDSISKHKGLGMIPCENEQGAAIAAESYARLNGIGVAIATSGPGMINLMQGIACAYYDSIPVLYISGAPPTTQLKGDKAVRQLGFQEMDVVSIVRPITKYAALVTDPNEIVYELEKAMRLAQGDRGGPVLLDIPDDVQRADIDIEFCKHYSPFVPGICRIEPNCTDYLVDQVIPYLERSSRPLIVLGNGIHLAGVEKECRELLKKLDIPYTCSWSAIDLSEYHDTLYAGNFGISASVSGNIAVQSADLLLCLGTRLDTHMTGNNVDKFAPSATKIVVDIDRGELVKSNGMTIDIPIHCNVKKFIERLLLRDIKLQNTWSWKNMIREDRYLYPICTLRDGIEDYRCSNEINPYVFMDTLSQCTKDNDIIITDAGATLTWTMQGYNMIHKQRLYSAFNHSPMGYSLPAAIGAKCFAPETDVICIIGDGGLQMNIQELETVVYNKLDIKIFVLDNSGYGIIKQTQDTWMNSHYVAADESSGLGFPDIVKVAKAYGLRTYVICNNTNLENKINKVLSSNVPMLCVVKIPSDFSIRNKVKAGQGLESTIE